MDGRLRKNKTLCVDCQKIFSKPSNLTKHIKQKHPDKFNAACQKQKYLCEECGEQIRTLVKFKIHMRGHVIIKRPNIVTCPICKLKESKKKMITHFNEKHDITISYENLEFSTMENFNLWKNKLEDENVTKFVRKRGAHQNSCGATNINFYCHRSGIFRNEGSGKRHLKLQGSCKINGFCPAEMKLKMYEGRCHVLYCKTHVGHSMELEHIQLSAKERESIAEKIALKIPFTDILNETRDSLSNCKPQRLHLLKRKDLYNIEQNFKLSGLSVRHHNDTKGMEDWMNDIQNNDYREQIDFDNFENDSTVTDTEDESIISSEDNSSIIYFSPNKNEETETMETVSKENKEGNLQNEVAEYFNKFVDNAVKTITTYEEFEAVRKLLAPVQTTLAAMKNNSKVHEAVETIIPQRKIFIVKNRKTNKL